jgi:predicted RNase H-like nuclease (RuvC/YqgF family)
VAYLCFHSVEGGSSESMVANVTSEIKLQVDKIEVLSPNVVPLQNDIAALTTQSEQLQAEIAAMKITVASNATDKAAKDDTISNTANDIMFLKQNIAQKKAEIDPLPGQIDVRNLLTFKIITLISSLAPFMSNEQECVAETERLEKYIEDYQVRCSLSLSLFFSPFFNELKNVWGDRRSTVACAAQTSPQ